MASDAQIRANQANAQLSTGPRSPEGKERVSQNARRHGLNSHVILPEDQPEFDALEAELRQALQPQGTLEEIFFDQILSARWNMIRVSRLEAELLFETGGADPLAHPDTERKANLYLRYQQRFEGSYRRALKELKQLQTVRAYGMDLDHEPQPPLADPMQIERFAEQTEKVRAQYRRAELLGVQTAHLSLRTTLLSLQAPTPVIPPPTNPTSTR
jgi:hypothetical protein